LSDTLVDDLGGNLGKTMNVGFAGAEIAPFDSVVKEAKYRVAVVLVVLGGVDSSLSGDRVGAAGAVLIAEAIDLYPSSERVAAADPPARPEPTTMILNFRLLAGLMSLESILWDDHFSPSGPAGTLLSRLIAGISRG